MAFYHKKADFLASKFWTFFAIQPAQGLVINNARDQAGRNLDGV